MTFITNRLLHFKLSVSILVSMLATAGNPAPSELKGKVVLTLFLAEYHAMKVCWRSGSIVPLVLCPRHWMEVSGQLQAPVALPPRGRAPRFLRIVGRQVKLRMKVERARARVCVCVCVGGVVFSNRIAPCIATSCQIWNLQ
jgi:hypothetical protein